MFCTPAANNISSNDRLIDTMMILTNGGQNNFKFDRFNHAFNNVHNFQILNPQVYVHLNNVYERHRKLGTITSTTMYTDRTKRNFAKVIEQF